jgi:hypothetical protein
MQNKKGVGSGEWGKKSPEHSIPWGNLGAHTHEQEKMVAGTVAFTAP